MRTVSALRTIVGVTLLLLASTFVACGDHATLSGPHVLAPTTPNRLIAYQDYNCNGDGWETNGPAFDCKDLADVHVAYLGT